MFFFSDHRISGFSCDDQDIGRFNPLASRSPVRQVAIFTLFNLKKLNLIVLKECRHVTGRSLGIGSRKKTFASEKKNKRWPAKKRRNK